MQKNWELRNIRIEDFAVFIYYCKINGSAKSPIAGHCEESAAGRCRSNLMISETWIHKDCLAALAMTECSSVYAFADGNRSLDLKTVYQTQFHLLENLR